VAACKVVCTKSFHNISVNLYVFHAATAAQSQHRWSLATVSCGASFHAWSELCGSCCRRSRQHRWCPVERRGIERCGTADPELRTSCGATSAPCRTSTSRQLQTIHRSSWGGQSMLPKRHGPSYGHLFVFFCTQGTQFPRAKILN